MFTYITTVTAVVCYLNTGMSLVKDNNNMHHCYYYKCGECKTQYGHFSKGSPPLQY